MITVNKDRAVEALAIIETYPERHDQGGWRVDYGRRGTRIEEFHDDPLHPACKTAFCLAGWVCVLDGVKWAMDKNGSSVAHLIGDPDRCVCPPEQPFCDCYRFMTAGYYAMARLGLEVNDADALFNSECSLEDLRVGVKALMNGDSVEAKIEAQYETEDD